jgi:hypothetical protein
MIERRSRPTTTHWVAMRKHPHDVAKTRFARRGGWLAVCALLLSPALGLCVTVSDLYQTAQPITGSQDAAIAEALRTVVVRVSGQRDAAERLSSALKNPRQFVQRFGVTADNILEVGFDDVSIDRLLLDANLPIWGRERPATLVVLGLDELGGRWVSADAPQVDRDRLEAAARERGVPLRWVILEAQDQNQLSAGAAPSAMLQIAERHGANALLVGRGRRDGGIQWMLTASEASAQANGAWEEGVHLVADTFARVFAVAGSSLSHVSVEVAGISDLTAYATTTSYLEAMTLVRNVALEQLAGDTLRFRLTIRGTAGDLRRAIALDDRLVPLALTGDTPADPSAAAPGDRLAFRYRP